MSVAANMIAKWNYLVFSNALPLLIRWEWFLKIYPDGSVAFKVFSCDNMSFYCAGILGNTTM